MRGKLPRPSAPLSCILSLGKGFLFLLVLNSLNGLLNGVAAQPANCNHSCSAPKECVDDGMGVGICMGCDKIMDEMYTVTYDPGIATLSCATPGYNINEDDREITCDTTNNNVWPLPFPTCTVNQNYCPDNPVPNGVLTGSGRSLGNVSGVNCSYGYNATSQTQLTCTQANATHGVWSDVPTCKVIVDYCLGNPVSNGAMTDERKVGAQPFVNCSRGYGLHSSGSFMCMPLNRIQGTWANVPTCAMITDYCPDVKVANGVVAIPSREYQAILSVQCNFGYQLSSKNHNNTCSYSNTTNGEWGPIGTCNRITFYCPWIYVRYGIFNITGYGIGDSLYVKCHNGYEPKLAVNATCNSLNQIAGKWSATPTCELINMYCNSSLAVQHGVVTRTGSRRHDRATVQCEQGYELSTERGIATCTEKNARTGMWANVPLCTAISAYCAATPSIQNGNFIATSTSIGSTATVTCDDGYRALDGTATCSVDNYQTGQWRTVPLCTAITAYCPPAQNVTIQNGTFVADVRTLGSAAQVICDAGFQVSSTSPVPTCMKARIWVNVPTCAEIPFYCPETHSIPNGAAVIPLRAIGNTGYLFCDTGFRLVPNDTVISISCARSEQRTGQWVTSATCEAVLNYCAQPSVANANVTASNLTLSSTATVVCDLGYQFSVPRPSSPMTCVAGITNQGQGGGWTNVPSCEKVSEYCKDNIAIDNVNNTAYEDRQLNGVVAVTCKLGYEISAAMPVCSTQNETHGTWRNIPTCKTITGYCSSDIAIDNQGTITYGGRNILNLAYVTCQPGYELSDPTANPRCTGHNSTSGIWTNVPSCQLITSYCPAGIPIIDNGAVSTPTSRVINTTATATCNFGYTPQSQTITCSSGKDGAGTWENLPKCTLLPTYCSSQITIQNAMVNYTVRQLLGKAVITCDNGYERLAGPAICSVNNAQSGTWTNIFECQAKPGYCSTLPTIVNGVVTRTSNTSINAIAKVTCSSGYQLSSTLQMTCIAGTAMQGTWENVPACKAIPKYCAKELDNRTNFASVEYSAQSIGGSATITCDLGYELPQTTLTTTCSLLNATHGQWNNIPSCSLIWSYCPVALVPAVTNGQVEAPATGVLGTLVRVICHFGYQLSPSAKHITCNADTNQTGLWSTTTTCDAITNYCPTADLPTVLMGAVATPSTTTINAGAAVICNHGYELSSSTPLNCTADTITKGVWINAPTCNLKESYCKGNINAGADAYNVTYHGLKLGDSASIFCKHGWEHSGAMATCIAQNENEGNWDNVPTCSTILDYCQTTALPNITNGVATSSARSHGATAAVQCNNGYELSSQHPINCTALNQTQGTWSNIPSCDKISNYCSQDIPLGSNYLNITYYERKLDDIATVNCKAGYELDQMDGPTCGASRATTGMWTNIPNCILNENFCPSSTLPNIPHGTVNQPERKALGYSTGVTCDHGYYLRQYPTGPLICKVIRGTDIGSWQQVPSCNAITTYCKASISRENMNVVYNGRKLHDSANVTCHAGYKVSNASAIPTCRVGNATDGVWHNVPTCQVITSYCPTQLPDVVNGRVTPPINYQLGQLTFTTCYYGYEHQGEVFIKCAFDSAISGRWTGAPLCKAIPDYCSSDISNISSDDSIENITYFGRSKGSEATILCSFGYELTWANGTANGASNGTAECATGNATDGKWVNVPVCSAIPTTPPPPTTMAPTTVTTIRPTTVITPAAPGNDDTQQVYIGLASGAAALCLIASVACLLLVHRRREYKISVPNQPSEHGSVSIVSSTERKLQSTQDDYDVVEASYSGTAPRDVPGYEVKSQVSSATLAVPAIPNLKAEEQGEQDMYGSVMDTDGVLYGSVGGSEMYGSVLNHEAAGNENYGTVLDAVPPKVVDVKENSEEKYNGLDDNKSGPKMFSGAATLEPAPKGPRPTPSMEVQPKGETAKPPQPPPPPTEVPPTVSVTESREVERKISMGSINPAVSKTNKMESDAFLAGLSELNEDNEYSRVESYMQVRNDPLCSSFSGIPSAQDDDGDLYSGTIAEAPAPQLRSSSMGQPSSIDNLQHVQKPGLKPEKSNDSAGYMKPGCLAANQGQGASNLSLSVDVVDGFGRIVSTDGSTVAAAEGTQPAPSLPKLQPTVGLPVATQIVSLATTPLGVSPVATPVTRTPAVSKVGTAPSSPAPVQSASSKAATAAAAPEAISSMMSTKGVVDGGGAAQENYESYGSLKKLRESLSGDSRQVLAESGWPGGTGPAGTEDPSLISSPADPMSLKHQTSLDEATAMGTPVNERMSLGSKDSLLSGHKTASKSTSNDATSIVGSSSQYASIGKHKSLPEIHAHDAKVSSSADRKMYAAVLK